MTDYAVEFRPTPRLRRLATIAALAVLAAILSARGELAVVAVAPLVLLTMSPRSLLPQSVQVGCELQPRRCVEHDELALTLEVHAPGVDRVEAAVRLPTHTEARLEEHHRAGTVTTARWLVVPTRWGRYRTGPVHLRLTTARGLYAAGLDV